MFWFVLFMLLIGAGCAVYLYQKLLNIEREIRQEQTVLSVDDEDELPAEPVEPKISVVKETPDLEYQVLQAVEKQPGIKQTALYQELVDIDRKKIQALLKDLDDAGKLRREKKGNSYDLFPA